MSASEKLQALDLGPGTIDDAELGMMGYDGLLVLRDVLPPNGRRSRPIFTRTLFSLSPISMGSSRERDQAVPGA